MGWVRSKFDREGRLTEETTYAGAFKPGPWATGANENTNVQGKTTYEYPTNTIRITDADGKVTTLARDGLGRVVSTALGALSAATYGYNQFDAVTSVQQTDAAAYAPAHVSDHLKT